MAEDTEMEEFVKFQIIMLIQSWPHSLANSVVNIEILIKFA